VTSEESADRVLALAGELKQRGKRIVLDNCDNQFAADAVNAAWQRALDRLRTLAHLSDSLVVCSEALAEVMNEQTDPGQNIRVIGDPAELRIRSPRDSALRSFFSPQRKRSWLRYWQHRLRVREDAREGRTPLVWFGSHGNHFAVGGMLELAKMRKGLEARNRSHPISLSVISNHRPKFEQHFCGWSFPVRYLEWDRVTFLAALPLHAISLIPTEINDFTRCKSSNRVVLSLAHGLAVVADEIPSYREFSEVIHLGDIEYGLNEYLSDPALRRHHVAAGRRIVASRYSLSAIAEQWRAVLTDHPAK
jgi:hypothetical protein